MCNELLNNDEYIKFDNFEYVDVLTGDKIVLEKNKYKNLLALHNPELTSQLHPTLNRDLKIDEVMCSTNKKLWWICNKGHHWEATVYSRSSGCGCPYCANQKVWIGFNDMWTTNPKLAKLLANPEDGYKYMQGSHKKVDWKCPDCGEVVKNKSITNIAKRGVSCPKCSDNISYPEKIMYHILCDINIKFQFQKSFDWSDRKLYDFYIPSLNVIIETHGKQHYEESSRKKGRTLKEEQANDKYKYELAIANGILPENYIVVDCRKSDIEWIFKSVKQTKLNNIVENVDLESINEKTSSTLIKVVAELWNDSENISNIMKVTNLSVNIVQKYLRTAKKLRWCSYDGNQQRIANIKKSKEKYTKKIVQLTKDLEYINTWKNVNDILKDLNETSGSNIYKACGSKNRTAYGFRWLFLKDYNEMVDDNNEKTIPKTVRRRLNKVVKLDENNKYITTYDSITEAAEDISEDIKNTMNRISACCTGKQASARGFKWMYLKDYEKMNEEQNKIS